MKQKEQKQAGCSFKTSVGGQALMEGIMMRGPEKMAMAIRQPDGTLYVEEKAVISRPWKKWVFVRGLLNFGETLIQGYQCLMKSAEISMGDAFDAQESKFDKWLAEKFGDKGMNFVTAIAALLGGGLAIVLFMVLPTLLVGLVEKFVSLGGFKAVLEGVLKLTLLIGYMALVSRLKEIARMFAYHGAEHKTIFCYEAGQPLTVENIKTFSRYHPRCGTSFLLIVIAVSILVGAVLPWENTGLRVFLKLLLLPVVVAISYEIIKLCGRYDNIATRIISAPGQWLQHITTNEPDEDMIECAIAAITPVLPEDKEQGAW